MQKQASKRKKLKHEHYDKLGVAWGTLDSPITYISQETNLIFDSRKPYQERLGG